MAPLHEDAGNFTLPAQWAMGQVAQDMPETEQSATEFVVEGDTVLLAARQEVQDAEATDDYDRMAHAYSALHDAGAHDEPLTNAEVVGRGLVDAATWTTVQKAALALFTRGQEIAKRAGLLLADTKYEFGTLPNGEVIIIDEMHTPDSSRFWELSSYEERLAAG